MSDGFEWLARGTGTPPQVRWSFVADSGLAGLALARETGEALVADTAGGLYRLDRNGRAVAMNRGFHALGKLALSDTGGRAVAVLGERKLALLDGRLQVQWSLELPDVILEAAVDPHGHYLAASLAGGTTVVLDDRRKRVGRFETVRPLSHLRFLASAPLLLGAADYGLLCCHGLDGEEVWSERLWTNVGDFDATGDGETVYVAAFNQGVKMFSGDGTGRGSYLVEGTPHCVATSFAPRRLAVATLERALYWLDEAGHLLWAAEAPDGVRRLCGDPLGRGVLCGFETGRLVRLGWNSPHSF